MTAAECSSPVPSAGAAATPSVQVNLGSLQRPTPPPFSSICGMQMDGLLKYCY